MDWFYSDNCAGQIKNQMFIALYTFLIAVGYFDVIDHKFLVSGHSFSASDRDFALIEKKARTFNLQTPADVETVIKSARNVRPFTVLNLEDKPIFNFSERAKALFNTSKLQISKLCWLRVQKSDLTTVLTKKSFSSKEPFTACKIAKKGLTSKLISEQILSLEAVNEKPQIDKAKLKDIKGMLPYVQGNAKNFFTDLLIQQGAMERD